MSSEDRSATTDEEMRPLVLVVDDDDVHRAVSAAVLEAAGMATIQAESAAAALEVVGRERVDAVLVDHRMPGMTGVELTERLRELSGHRMTPVLFVSADDDPELRVEALKAGATDFIVKPYVFEELAARVQAQLLLSSQWQAKLEHIRERAATVTDIAALNQGKSPTATAREICRRISRNHGGRSVAILAWADRDAEPVPLAVCGSRSFLDRSSGLAVRLRTNNGAWIHYPSGPRQSSDEDGQWLACAPLKLGPSPVGVLAVQGGGSQDELLAAVADYASTATLQLGPALSESRLVGERRRAVEDVLDRRAFTPVFQPVIDLRRHRVVGYEALTRLTSGEPILQLLSDAEDARILPRTELALLEASVAAATTLPGGVWMSVNLSPSVLLGHVRELGRVVGSSHSPVVVELTEHERIEDYPAVRSALSDLGDEVRLSVDDTGSGYASLRHVLDLRPHFLKLDRSWVAGVDGDEVRKALIAGMVAFCDHTSTELIAEGIETEPELTTLQSLGVPYGQGFLLGRPAPRARRAPAPP